MSLEANMSTPFSSFDLIRRQCHLRLCKWLEKAKYYRGKNPKKRFQTNSDITRRKLKNNVFSQVMLVQIESAKAISRNLHVSTSLPGMRGQTREKCRQSQPLRRVLPTTSGHVPHSQRPARGLKRGEKKTDGDVEEHAGGREGEKG